MNYNKCWDIPPQNVMEEFLEEEKVTIKSSPEPEMVTVNCKKLNVRKDPSKEGKILTSVLIGTELMVEEQQGEWFKVYTPSGIDGYVMTQYVTPVLRR